LTPGRDTKNTTRNRTIVLNFIIPPVPPID
jgi:hypothetical protein